MFGSNVCILLLTGIIIASNVSATNGLTQPVQSLRVLIIVSSNDDRKQNAPLWERGEELIPGALLAAEEVNTREDILKGFQIELVPLMIPNCHIGNGILKAVEQILAVNKSPIIGIAGLFCNKLVEAISPLFSHNEISLIQLSGAIAVGTRYYHFYSTLARVDCHIEAILDLMQQLNWTKIGLLHSVVGSDNYYVKATEAFVNYQYQNRNRSVEILLHGEVGIEGKHGTTADHVINRIELSEVRIVVAFLTPYQALDMICKAYHRGLTWPTYAWIFIDTVTHDIIDTPITKCDEETLWEAMENVIFVNHMIERENQNTILVSNKKYSSYVEQVKNGTDTFNPFTNVVYDSVWGLSLAVNNSIQDLQQMNLSLGQQGIGSLNSNITKVIETHLLKTHFIGASGMFAFDKMTTRQLKRSVEIVQVQNQSSVLIGRLHTCENFTTFNLSMLNREIPTDEVPRVYDVLHIAAAVFLYIGQFLCLIFVTVVFAAFIYYRKEAEVKATSISLSICMFIGCYFMLSGAVANTYSNRVIISRAITRRSICILEAVAITVGVDLILATVLAKTMRIAHVFSKFKNTGRAWSDIALLVMIALITAGKFVLHILWISVDLYHLIDKEVFVAEIGYTSYYRVFQFCSCNLVGLWLALNIGYTAHICVALVILAIKTRKIKRENFKDTKKLNGLIVVIFSLMVVSTTMWGLFRLVGLHQGSKITSSVAYTAVPFLCQVFLFLPKIIPPFRRHMKKLTSSVKIPTDQSNTSEQHVRVQHLTTKDL